jgi:transposase-like protein
MQISDVTCPQCNAGYRRLQLSYQQGTTGEYRCRCCDHVLEVFDGSTCVAFRLTVHPEKVSHAADASAMDPPLRRRQRALR